MAWQTALAVLVVINNISILLTKMAADRMPRRAVGVFYQYLFCAGFAASYVFWIGEFQIPMFVLTAMVGIVNAFGNYFQWRASGLSLSKTVLFFPLMEVITIVLAVTFMSEAVLWNPQLIIGAGLCFVAMWLFRIAQKEREEAKGQNLTTYSQKNWFVFALGMVLIQGTAGFLVKVFALRRGSGSFFSGWYGGSLVGALPILLLEKSNPRRLTRANLAIVLPLSLATFGAMFFLYTAYESGPVSLVLPIRGLCITVIPALIGWFALKEIKGLFKKEWLGFLAGVAGVILVLLR